MCDLKLLIDSKSSSNLGVILTFLNYSSNAWTPIVLLYFKSTFFTESISTKFSSKFELILRQSILSMGTRHELSKLLYLPGLVLLLFFLSLQFALIFEQF